MRSIASAEIILSDDFSHGNCRVRLCCCKYVRIETGTQAQNTHDNLDLGVMSVLAGKGGEPVEALE